MIYPSDHVDIMMSSIFFSSNSCVCFQVPENCVFFVNIHEPIIWRLHEMVQHLKIDRICTSQPSAVSIDPILKIGYAICRILIVFPFFFFPVVNTESSFRLLNISEVRFRVSMAMSPTQRPRGVLGFWSSLMTALGNMEHMPVGQRFNFLSVSSSFMHYS